MRSKQATHLEYNLFQAMSMSLSRILRILKQNSLSLPSPSVADGI